MAFNIKVKFSNGLTDVQMQGFDVAASRWSEIISGDLPSVTVDGNMIDDLLIRAEGERKLMAAGRFWDRLVPS